MFDRLSRGHVPIEEVGNPRADPEGAKQSRAKLQRRAAKLPGRRPLPNIKPVPKHLVYALPSVERARRDDPRTYPEYKREYTPGPDHGVRRREAIASQYDYFDRLNRYNEQMEHARRDKHAHESEAFVRLSKMGDIKGFEGHGKPKNKWIEHVRKVQQMHGLSWKDAMKRAKGYNLE